MPARDWKFRIEDILEAIDDIVKLTAGMAYESFHKDTRTLKAVIYNIAIIGEAARHVPDFVKERFPDLPWREMGDMRNMVVHEYFGVDTDILWETIQRDLPPLRQRLAEIP